MTARRTDVTEFDIRSRYERGISVLQMSKELRLARVAVVKRLQEMGLPVRGGSEANAIRLSRMSSEERRGLAAAAHAARRGSSDTARSMEMRAHARRTQPATRIEAVFVAAMSAAGLAVETQFPVGRWSVDIAIPDLRTAVEIDPGHWHTTPRKAATDARKDAALAELGWRVVRFSGHAIRNSNPNIHEVARQMVAERLCGCAR